MIATVAGVVGVVGGAGATGELELHAATPHSRMKPDNWQSRLSLIVMRRDIIA